MNFCDINPFIRFAEYVFHPRLPENPVFVKDCRILYVISGEAELFIENQHYELIPNSLFYCSAGHTYIMQSSGVKILALNFDLTQRDNVHTEFYPRISLSDKEHIPSINLETVDDSEFINSHLFIANANDCLNPLKKILNEFSMQKIYYRENSSALLKNLLVELHRYSISGTPNSATTVSQIMDYIKNHYDKPLNNEMLSAMSGYHEYHLNRLFMKHAGTSVHKYILNIRINEAKKLLLTTEQSLAFIAEKVGFNSNTHFSSYFKQVIGISPLEFRKQFKNKL
ncbi:MAG: helix-turn-helix transcriptional regulator [Tyzzerella sp.]|nr:helix-turn-helix transcriptional regulator [Tyzzerella sp.]